MGGRPLLNYWCDQKGAERAPWRLHLGFSEIPAQIDAMAHNFDAVIVFIGIVVVMYFPAQRLLCPISLSCGLTVYSCCGCGWHVSVQGDDPAGPEAFESHRCEDFPIMSDFFLKS